MSLAEPRAAKAPAELFVSLGETRYRVRRPWGDLAGFGGMVSDVTADDRGHAFVLLRRDPLTGPPGPAVVELDRDGRVVAHWGEEIADGHMLARAPDGRIFVVDRDAHRVAIFDANGTMLGELGERGRPMSPFNHPSGVAFGLAGELFVCDGYANSRVHRFSAEGALLLSWGERGTEPGRFLSPHGIWVLADGRVAVADRDNHRVQLFSPDGRLLDVWSGFYRPNDIWGDSAGNLYVADQVPSLTRLSGDGTALGRCRPVLNGAHGIWGLAGTGALLLAEGNPSRLTRLEPA